MALNPKQRVFVREFLKDKNATRAYIAAGYGKKGAAAAASRMLRNVKVAEAVEKGLARLEAKLDISAERILSRLADFAYQPLTAREMKNSAGINALRACEMLGKHFKLFTELHEHTGKNGGPQVIVMLPGNGSEVAPPSIQKAACAVCKAELVTETAGSVTVSKCPNGH